MRVSDILSQIDMGSVALPEFQRGYVWNRDQVKDLMYSLYRKYPIGSLLVWSTKTEQVVGHARGDRQLNPGVVKLLLDGQQRITSLYGIVRGKAPQFFQGNAQAFTGLYFKLDHKLKEPPFEFYSPKKMDDNPLWINVTELMQKGIGEFAGKLHAIPAVQNDPNLFATYLARLNDVDGIQRIDLHIEEVTGEDKTVDVVVEIFNKVNSGGTKLSKGDLALAKICAADPDARENLRNHLAKWSKAGFYFSLDWLLRCITVITTGKATFAALDQVNPAMFRDGLRRADKAIDTILNVLSSRLGLDHDRVLGSPASIPLMVRYLDQNGGDFPDFKEQDKLLYWYVHTILWGRYAGSTETVLSKDLAAIDPVDGGSLDRLIAQLQQNRGDLCVRPSDFQGWSVGSRFYPLLYMLSVVCGARDWGNDIKISAHMLGKTSSLEIHHIFPKSKLYARKYSRNEVNALANFTFLTKQTNLKVSNQDPKDYFPFYETKHPHTIFSHWIPADTTLWEYENYKDFLTVRRQLLADAANSFLDSLYSNAIPQPQPSPDILQRELVVVPGGVSDEEEEQVLEACNEWVSQQGLPPGNLLYELVEAETGEAIAILDLAWTNGLQEGLSQPVALLLDEPAAVEQAVNQAGYRYFTNVDQFKDYVQHEILALELAEAVVA